MKKIKVYWLLMLLLFLTGFVIGKNNNSIFRYYNPDVNIQSAFIKDGFILDYSIPDLTTFSHLRLTYEYDSVDAIHIGIGYPMLDAGVSTHLFNWDNNSVRFILIGGISSIKGPFFIQVQVTSSLIKKRNSEYGINLAAGYNAYGMWELHCKSSTACSIMHDYLEAGQPDFYLKQEVYYIKKLIDKLDVGFAAGLTECLSMFYRHEAELIRFQFGLTLKYRF